MRKIDFKLTGSECLGKTSDQTIKIGYSKKKKSEFIWLGNVDTIEILRNKTKMAQNCAGIL